MNINTISSIYFLGAGGIGMSALIRFFLSKGKNVGGYDRTPSELTTKLMEEGALLHFEDNVELIGTEFKDKYNTLVIVTPAIPKTNLELNYFISNGFTIMKRSQVLGALTQTSKGLCVAGTHGKTTTSTMAAHLLYQSEVGCNAFLGGISKNYDTNLLLSASSEYVVIEADEFDRSFHWLTPFATIVTATDADHLDIYGTKGAYLESFSHYTSLIKSGGYLIVHEGLEFEPRVNENVTKYSYAKESGDFHAENIRIGNGEIVFDFVSPLGNIPNIQLGVPVLVNVENGIAAMALAQLAGVSSEEIKKGMASFKGVERRFDFKIKNDRTVLLTDYAHHPAEIRESILSLKALYPNRKVAGIFQPHLYSRTNDFYQEFAESLSLLDEVILTEIYPARELPIPGVTSKLIFDNLRSGMIKQMCEKSNVVSLVEREKTDVLIVLGAGDIDKYVPQLVEKLK